MVDPGHRRHGLAIDLLFKTRDFFETRFTEIIEREPIGILLTLENEAINAAFQKAAWSRTGFICIDFNQNGYQMRIYYFNDADI